MATYKQGSSQDLLQTLSSYLGFPTPGAARALQTLLTQRREILLHPLSKKVCFWMPIPVVWGSENGWKVFAAVRWQREFNCWPG